MNCVLLHMWPDDVATIAWLTEILLGDIVGQFALEEKGLAIFTRPNDLVVQHVLGKEPIHDDIIAVDCHRVPDFVARVLNRAIPGSFMISSPQPQVVSHNIVGVDFNHIVGPRLGQRCIAIATDPTKNIVHKARVCAYCSFASPPLQERVCACGSSLQEESRDSDTLKSIFDKDQTVHVGCILGRHHRSHAQSKQDSVAVADDDGLIDLVDAR
mmetsp:Transcript_22713/g.34100  ORF Transcript_22713/g.34100 Transcript_22713/m.34100 type:complete len:213 (-) Transcript_22713:336-974(-)